MKHSRFNLVRTLRLRSAMTTDELARLLGQRSGTAISQFEAGDRVPTLRGALALQVVFGLNPHEMFPALFSEVEEAAMRRAHEQYEALDGKPGRRAETKRALFEEMARRDPNHRAA